YAPARYERAVLMALRDGRPGFEEDLKASDRWRSLVVEDARSYLEKPPQGIPTEPSTVQVALGLVAYAQGDLPQARGSFEAAPFSEEAQELLGMVIRREILPSFEKNQLRYLEAEKLFSQGIERDRGYLPHYIGRAELRWSRGSRRRHRGFDPMPDYRAAEEDCSAALKVDPLAARALQFRGQVRVYQGIWSLETDHDPSGAGDAAVADLTKAIQIEPPLSG